MARVNTDFKPSLRPKEMLAFGVFGGWYFGKDIAEYPKEWFKDAKISKNGFNVQLNFFKVQSGQSGTIWKSKGWITPEDPLGWFQWYCRYFMGRRISDIDQIQIGRWRSFGPRHRAAVMHNCSSQDLGCRPRQRQALLQWAYDPFFSFSDNT